MKYENIKINDIDHFGRGITRINDKVVFVNNALIDEVVDIQIYKTNKKYDEANVIEYKQKSKYRVEPKCKYYNICGGCDIMHLSYDQQLEFKKNKVINIFKKYANLTIEPTIIPSKDEFYYRNKITLHYKNNKLGFYKKETNDIVQIDECIIAKSIISNYIKKIDKLEKNIIIKANDKSEIISNYTDKNSFIKTIKNLKFKVSLNSFFQVNDYICEKLFEIISKNINSKDEVLDLYSGVSTLGIVASLKAKKVYNIESNPSSFKNALENIELNNRKNVVAIHGKVEEVLKNFERNFNTVIIDPPRSGLDNWTINFLLKKKTKKIIYISCNPMSLVRDFNKLKNNYVIKDFILLDMFAQTYHVECVCVLNYRKPL